MTKRGGFTLIEVMIALVILALVILGLTTATATFVNVVAKGQLRATAIQMAEARIDRIEMDPNYIDLETNYKTTETTFPGLTGYTRVTDISHVGGAGKSVDYKVITVTVMRTGLPDTIRRTVSVGAP